MIKFDNKTISSVFNGEKTIEKIFKGTLKLYEAWRNLIVSAVPPLTLTKCKGVDLVDYKLYGNSVQGKLPSEYQQVEYIKCDGNSWIDSEEYATENTKVIFDYKRTDTSLYYFGCYSEINKNSYYAFETKNKYQFGLFSSYETTSIDVDNNRHQMMLYVENSIGYVKLDDTIIWNKTIEPSAQSYYPLIFGSGYNGKVVNTNRGFNGNIYGIRIYQNNILNKNFVPCYRKSDNVIGMYDLVNNTFYINSGTGTFLKGDNTPMPEVPIEVESVADKTKNLFNIKKAETFYKNGSVEETKTETGYTLTNAKTTANFIIIKIGNTSEWIGKTLRVSYNATNEGSINWVYFDENGGNRQHLGSKTITVDNTNVCFGIRINASTTDQNLIFEYTHIQIEEGTKVTKYEPCGYKIPVKVSNGTEEIITNIYLDEPLRKIGDYKDYIDFKNKKVVRNIKELVCNGSEDWMLSSSKLSNCYNLNITDMVSNAAYTGLLLYSTHFKGSQEWHTASDRSGLVLAYVQYIGIGYANIQDKIGATVEEFKIWLEEQYNNGTPLEIYYPLTTPTEETIQLANIPTFKGTTIIEVDTEIQPSNLEVVYKGKK